MAKRNAEHKPPYIKDISTFSVQRQIQMIASIYQLVSRDSNLLELQPLKARLYELLALEYPADVVEASELSEASPEE